MILSEPGSPEGRSRGRDRRVPGWAAGLFADLARDQPSVVTRDDLAQRLVEVGSGRDVDRTVQELRRLGWLAPVGLHDVWAFVPPGRAEVLDPYLAVRAWRARNPEVAVRLAGDNSAWHLGYLGRQPGPPVSLWLPSAVRIPDGLRPSVSVVRLRWPADMADRLGPRAELLQARRLDPLRWSSRLPSFGPEALLVQLAARPSSFRSWTDLVDRLDRFAADVDVDRACELLAVQSVSAWQRAAYLLHQGRQEPLAMQLFSRRPPGPRPVVTLAATGADDIEATAALFSSQFGVVDRLVAPLQLVLGKA